jgi:RNA polymerase sigma-70 factor (ECF subfamily)
MDLAGLVREHQRDVWRYLRFLGAARDDADDLTQETFLAVAKANFQRRSRTETSAYLRTVARNQLLMLRRREGRRITTTSFDAAEAIWVANHPQGDSHLLLDALTACLEQLQGRSREAVWQFYREGRSREELAARLHITAQGVKTLLRRTRDILKRCIQQKQSLG